ncbi:MAG: sulfatase [Planctomycetota bacterium]
MLCLGCSKEEPKQPPVPVRTETSVPLFGRHGEGFSTWRPQLPFALGDAIREAVVVPRRQYLRLRGVPRHEGARLEVWCGIPPARWSDPEPIRLTIAEVEGGEERVLVTRELTPATDLKHRTWIRLEADLPGSGEDASPIDLILRAEGGADRPGALVAWSGALVTSRGRLDPGGLGPVTWQEPGHDWMPVLTESTSGETWQLRLPGMAGHVDAVRIRPGEEVRVPLESRGEWVKLQAFAIPGRRAPSGKVTWVLSWEANGKRLRLFEASLETSTLDVDEVGVRVLEAEAELPSGVGHLVFSVEGEIDGGLITGLTRIETVVRHAAPRARPNETPNVLVILVDTLRADHLGCYGYPRPTSPTLDRLAARGIRFERCLAQSSWTLPSVASLMTGLHPPAHGVVDAASGLQIARGVETMAERLSAAGFTTAAFSANFLVGPAGGFDRGFERFEALPFASAESLNRSVRAWLDEVGSHPFFGYVHYYDPHLPYAAPAPKTRRFVPEEEQALGRLDEVIERFHQVAQEAALFADRLTIRDEVEGHLQVGEGEIVISRWLRDRLIDLYDAEIRYWDDQLAELLEGLAARGLMDRTWLIITSDHGEAFGEHGYLAHGQTLYDELVRVPLIIVPPRSQSGFVETQAVEMTDIAPTVLSLLGRTVPETWRARPLKVDSPERGARRPAFSFVSARVREPGEAGPSYHELTATSDARWKAIEHEEGRLELYDVASDPGELEDVAKSEAKRAEERRAALERWRAATPRPASASGLLDPAVQRALQMMGYVSEGK